MEYFIVALIGFALGWYINSWFSAQAFYTILKDLGVDDKKIIDLVERENRGSDTRDEPEATAQTVEIKVEQHGTRLYAFTVDNDNFVAQGDSAEELFQQLIKKLPTGTRVSIDQGSELVRDYADRLKSTQ